MKRTNLIAQLTGLGYLIIFISGFFANFFILEGLVVEGDPVLTTLNFQNNTDAFERGLISFWVMVGVDVLLAWPLFLLLKQVSPKLARFSSLIRVINGVVFGLALFSLMKIAKLFEFPEVLRNSTTEELQTIVMTHLNSFESTWDAALILFGVHLLIMAYLLVRSVSFPKWIGVLIGLAGLAYLADSTVRLVWGDGSMVAGILEVAVIVAGVLGEFSFTLFLLIRGQKENELLASVSS
jgi:hypothetical protein